jgi:hypothetical protein
MHFAAVGTEDRNSGIELDRDHRESYRRLAAAAISSSRRATSRKGDAPPASRGDSTYIYDLTSSVIVPVISTVLPQHLLITFVVAALTKHSTDARIFNVRSSGFAGRDDLALAILTPPTH